MKMNKQMSFSMLRRLSKLTKISITAIAVITAATIYGCSKSSTTDTAAAGVTVAGTVGTISASAMSDVGVMAVAATDLEVYGLAMSEPPEVKKVNLGADGSFSLEFSSAAAGAEISLIFRYKTGTTNAGKQVGLVKFVDDSKKNIDGTASTESSMKLSGTVSLGTLTIDANGEVKVPISQVATNNQNVAVTPTTATDFSGTWKFAAFDKTLPEGYSAACPAGSNNCNGPQVDEVIYFKVIPGKSFTPSSASGDCTEATALAGTCVGTVGTADRFAMSVWRSAAAWAACGNKLGFPYSLARKFANVDFTNSGVPEGAHTYTAGWVDGWQSSSAVATRGEANCVPVAVTMPDNSTKNGNKCFDNTSSPASYMVSFGGGCKNTDTNAPVHITNWGSVTGGSCQSTTTGLPAGYQTNTCTYTGVNHDGDAATPVVNLTCPFTNGTFRQDNNAAISPSGFVWSNAQLIAPGGSCGDPTTGTDSQKIAKLKCHAQYYQQQRESNASLCLQEMTLNWATTNPAEFAKPATGAPKAGAQHAMTLFTYTSPTSGFLEDEDIYYSGVQVGDAHIPCKVKSRFKATVKGRTATQAVFEFVSEQTPLDFVEPACAAANQTLKTLMLINKQP